AAANNTGRGGVTIVGGAASPATPAGAIPGAAPSYTPAGATSFGGGLRQIPSRSLRTDNVTFGGNTPVGTQAGSAPAAPIDPAKQYLNMAIQHEIHTSAGKPFPPPPPLPE